MSAAFQCDVCSALYEPTAGTLRLEVSRHTGEDFDAAQTWSDVDLCASCSEKTLAVIRPALLDFPK